MNFVDLARKPIAPGELRRFAQRFGAAALLDTDSPRYRELGLGYLSLDEDAALEKSLTDQRLLKLPLVRSGELLSVGIDENAWREWLKL